MLLHHRSGYGGRDVEVDVDDPDATVADLAAALEPDRPHGPVVVDGRPVSASTPLDRAGVGTGSTVDPAAPPSRPDAAGDPSPAVDAATSVVLVGGLDAGRRWALPPGSHVVGRALGASGADLGVEDPTVSREHAVLTVARSGAVTVADVGSTNGTWLGDRPVDGATPWPAGEVLRCGGTTLVHGPPRPRPTPRGSGPATAPPWPWHRRPVTDATPPDRTPIDAPDEEDPPPSGTGVGIAAVLGSLAVGLVMVRVLGSWMYALFALLGPVMVLAGAIDGRIRRRRSARRLGRRWRSLLTRFDRALTQRQADDLAGLTATYPGPASAVAASGAADEDGVVASEPADGLWAVRAATAGADVVRLGSGAVPWHPPVAGDPRRWADPVVEIVERHRVAQGPVLVALEPGRPLAVVGPASARRAVARSIVVQAAVSRGPADLRISTVVGRSRLDEWAWLRWLPHLGLPADGAAADGGDVPDDGTPGPRHLVLVDDPAGLRAGRSAARSAVRVAADPKHATAAVVLVSTRSDAPAACTIVEVDADGTLRAPPDVVAGPAHAWGTSRDVATRVARSLGRFVDPEDDDPSRDLPAVVTLRSLTGAEALTPAGIRARWSIAGADPRPVAVLGHTADGTLAVDLVADGPHALVAGTTGAGKSELLRSLVVSLALGCSPDHLVFVLVDFKGGSAFDACDRLPHTVGVVTDLDEGLAARALRCLDAELRDREARLRAVGAADLTAYRATAPDVDGEPMPRLVVVVDEFATLATELPEFVDALVGIAQRGRSLGVHLVLATQRPAGAVSDNIRANTALRISLRVQDPADSIDVLGEPAAALLPRGRPGRAFVRLGPGDLVPVQTTWTGARSRGPTAPRVRVRRLALTSDPTDGSVAVDRTRGDDVGAAGPDDLTRVVEATREAWTSAGGRAPRRPWPDPLPRTVDLFLPAGDRTEGPAGAELRIGLADEPDRQRTAPLSWRPADGPLLSVGRPGSGTTTALATVVLAAARRWDPGSLHVHVVDLGAGDLGALAGLPHVGAVIGADELERQRRLFGQLGDDLADRRTRPDEVRPTRLLVIDGIGALHDRWDDVDQTGTWARILEVVSRGSEVGIHSVLAADGATRIPTRLLSACRRRLVFQLAEAAEGAALGVPPRMLEGIPPGRAVDPEGPTLVQVGIHGPDRGAAVARIAASWPVDPDAARPRPVRVLPDLVLLSAVGGPPSGTNPDGSLRLAVGVSDIDLGPAHLVLAPGGHALVAGPPRSGRSTTLRTIAAAAVEAGSPVIAVARSPWEQRGVRWFPLDDPTLAPAVESLDDLLLLVDDADLCAADHPVLATLVADRRPRRHVVASGRTDRLRTGYSHWTRELRADRSGVLLRPDEDLDGDLLGARLPRRAPVEPAVGRGWLVGDPEGFAQIAIPPRDPK